MNGRTVISFGVKSLSCGRWRVLSIERFATWTGRQSILGLLIPLDEGRASWASVSVPLLKSLKNCSISNVHITMTVPLQVSFSSVNHRTSNWQCCNKVYIFLPQTKSSLCLMIFRQIYCYLFKIIDLVSMSGVKCPYLLNIWQCVYIRLCDSNPNCASTPIK